MQASANREEQNEKIFYDSESFFSDKTIKQKLFALDHSTTPGPLSYSFQINEFSKVHKLNSKIQYIDEFFTEFDHKNTETPENNEMVCFFMFYM